MNSIKLPNGEWRFDDARPLGPVGGFGAVLAGDGPDGAPVAVKRLHLYAGDLAHRELSIAREFMGKHFEHVMPILDAGQDADSDLYFVVMPIATRSLQDLLNTEGPVDEDRALNILRQITSGLIEVREIVHRDLKPGNVPEHDGKWKIADFGIARFVEASTSTLTLKDCLSPSYAAPEQWRIEQAIPSTDIYALGCIAHALLTGLPPFRGTADELRKAHLETVPSDLPNLRPAVRSLINMMLRKSPDARPSANRVHDVLTAPLTTGQRLSDVPLDRLASAAAAHERKETAAEAKRQAEWSRRETRTSLAKDGEAGLLEIARELAAKLKMVPGAQVSLTRTELLATVGTATLEVDLQLRSYEEGDFPRSKWNVACGSAVQVKQATLRHMRSASLWFTRREFMAEEFRWYEVGYMGNPIAGGRFEFQPSAVDAEVADRAHSAAMDVIQVAYRRIAIDGENMGEFVDRWLNTLAAAACGVLDSLGGGIPDFSRVPGASTHR